jgi:hypothetical protein
MRTLCCLAVRCSVPWSVTSRKYVSVIGPNLRSHATICHAKYTIFVTEGAPSGILTTRSKLTALEQPDASTHTLINLKGLAEFVRSLKGANA